MGGRGRGEMVVSQRWRRIDEARRLLRLPQRVSRRQIQEAYREAVRGLRDQGLPPPEADSRLAAINEAYRLLMAFADEYTMDLTPNEAGMTDEEWWIYHFGQDPVWSRGVGAGEEEGER